VRVLIDTSYAGRGVSGTSVYLERLIAALREGGRVELVTAAQRRRLAPGRGGGPRGWVRSAANALLDALWLHAGLPRAARLLAADLVHHPLPAHSRRIAVAQACTVHDAAFLHHPAGYGIAWRVLARRRYRAAARGCGALICPTRATAADLVSLLGADPGRVVVAHHGPGQAEADHGPGQAEADSGGPSGGSAAGPLVFVGDAEERKNLAGLLAAYAAYRARAKEPAPLVLAGGAAAQAGAPGVTPRRAQGPAEMLALLRGARALVHPSLHEGFGLTPLEAMAVGVPVLAVRNAGTEEVCGDAALLVEPDGLAAGIERIATDASLREDLARRGAVRARGFSWAQAACVHESAYTLALGAPPARDATP